MPKRERSRLILSSHALARYYERGGLKRPRRGAIERRLFGLLREGVTVDGEITVAVPWEGFVWIAVPDAQGGWVAVTALRPEEAGQEVSA